MRVASWLLTFVVGTCSFSYSGASDEKTVQFGRDIKPLLAEHCIKCHGPDKAEGGLDLSDHDRALRPLDSGLRAIVPHKIADSELLNRVRSTDVEVRMPPGEEKPLSAAEVSLLEKWIADGAEFQTHWSFQPLKLPSPPSVKDLEWIRNDIDRFVLKNLEEKEFTASPEAPPHVLIRRLYLDLIGLLPTPKEVDEFVVDYSKATAMSDSTRREAIYTALVDRLLASPHFGERWGRHWLDLARYADSDGYEKDRPRPDAYVYRDWVIQAFNDNMPFDQFTIEQLAGDLIPNATTKQQVATAFNRQTLTNTEGGVDQEEYRVAAVFDRTDTLGSVWMGLTLGCAKCHTHKYDPITHTEYYQMFAFFNDADERVKSIPIEVNSTEGMEKELQALDAKLESRYRAIYAAEQAWETEQRELIENGPNEPLTVVAAEAAGPMTSDEATLSFEQLSDSSWRVSLSESANSKVPDVGTYRIDLRASTEAITGFRIDVIPDDDVQGSPVGFTRKGNFVLSQVKASVVDSDGKKVRSIALQDAEADFEQAGYKAADAISARPNPRKGWAVSPKTKQAHWIQLRTKEIVKLKPDERVQVELQQNFGEQHLIRRMKISYLTGDARDLHLTKSIINALKMYPEKRTNDTRDLLFDFYASQDPQVQSLRKEIDRVVKKYDAKVMPVRMISNARQSRSTYRFDRGDFLSPAEEVKPGVLAVLPPVKFEGEVATRLDLAEWLVGPENPLTARVIANQFWMRLFGAGIVRSVGEFGVRAEVPSHPELLDWLAVTYRDSLRWNTKEYLKLILTSATYRQSSAHRSELVAIDPLNQMLARQNRLRVEAELVRDLALQVSGLLSRKIGGPSVFPPMPPELAKLSYANNFSWTDSKGEDRYRRGMYTFFKRTIPHPTLMTFDCPDANLTCVNRSVSNTPLQALTLLNNESFVEASQAFAKLLLSKSSKPQSNRSAGSTPDADDLDDSYVTKVLRQAFYVCLTREPDADELAPLLNLHEHSLEYYQSHPEDADALVGDANVPGWSTADTAATIATIRVFLNLDEFITRE